MVRPDILITAASRRVALVRAFQTASARLGLFGRVIATDIDPFSPAVHVADGAFGVPRSDEPGYVETLLEICEERPIGVLVPTIDDELEILAAAAPRFAAIGVRVVAPTVDTARICRDKRLTAAHLEAHGIPVARTWTPEEARALDVRPPLFIKPRRGRGSVGAFPVSTDAHLEFFLDYVSDPIVQEYLAGPEYTIDLFCDADGQPISAVPRERLVIRSGVTDRGRTVDDPVLIELACRCAAALSFRGAANVQCRVVDGTPVVFEINPRFSGGIQLTIAAGADFAEWTLRLARGEALQPCLGGFRSGLRMSSHESSLFFTDADARVLAPPARALVAARV